MRRRAVLAALPALLASRLAGADEPDEAAIFAGFAAWAGGSGFAALTPGLRVQAIATHPLLLGRPYRRGPLEGADEPLRAGFDAFDCVTFVETVLALAAALAQPAPSCADYRARLTAIRYRNGERAWCTRLHYFGDWARANVAAGRIVEVTNALRAGERPPPLAVASAHYRVLGRNLARSPLPDAEERRRCAAAMEARLAREQPVQRYLASAGLRQAAPLLEAGDLLAWVAARDDVDVVHLSLVVALGARRGLVHASLRAGRVGQVGDVAGYAASLGSARGVRVFRVPRAVA